MKHIALVYEIQRRPKQGAHVKNRPAVPDAAQLETELVALRVAVRKVEAKIMGHIQPADWETLNPDLRHVEEALNRVRSHVQGSHGSASTTVPSPNRGAGGCTVPGDVGRAVSSFHWERKPNQGD